MANIQQNTSQPLTSPRRSTSLSIQVPFDSPIPFGFASGPNSRPTLGRGGDLFAMSLSPDSLAQRSQPSVNPQDPLSATSHAYSAFDDASLSSGHNNSYAPFQPGLKGNSLLSQHLAGGAYPYAHSGASTSNLSDGSPMSAHAHRMSIGSNGPFGPQMTTGSVDDSDPTSPGSARGQGSLSGENINSISGANDNANNATPQSQDDKDAKSKEEKTEPLPPWSELKTKAGKERKRLPLACIACRRKKIRCSGEKPACKHCLRSRIPCVYKVTTRKAAPRTDYMAMLDKRLKRMEDRVIKCIPKEEQANIKDVARAVVKPAIPGLPPKSANEKKRAADQAFGEELDEWAKSRPVNVQKVPNPDGASLQQQRVPESDENRLLSEGAESLPSRELQQHLAEVYFDFVYGQNYHLLHKPSFMRKLAAGQIPPVLILAVCAISARFSSHPEIRTEPAFLRGNQWATPAREIALKRFDTPNITILIVYLILGLHEFGTCQGGRSWMFGGMAQRMAYALQLHKDLDYEPRGRSSNGSAELTFTDREIRRRTMWSCFMMDRFNSSGTDRPLFVNEQYISAQLPIKEHYFQMEITGPTEDLDGAVPNPVEPGTGQMSDPKENMGVAAYLVRLTTIWGRLIKYMNLGGKEKEEHPMWSPDSTFHEIKKAVDDWKASLPEALHYDQDNLQNHATEKTANQFIFIHIFYNQVILFMNRFALPYPGSRPPFTKEMPQQFISECGRAALDAANQISALVNEAMDHRVVAPFAGYCAFFSSTVHIHGVFSKNPALEASSKQNLAWNVKYISKMKKHWGMFHFVAENLKELYRKHADAALRGLHASNTPDGRKGQESIFQYGDWFDRYPHGVSGTDYEDPAVEVKKEPGSDAVLGQKSDLQSVEEFFAKLSPPSRGAVQKRQPRKKRTKSDAVPPTTAETAGNPPVPQEQQQNNDPQQALPPHNPQMMANLMNSNFQSPDHMNFNPNQFSSGFGHDVALLRAQQRHHQNSNPGIMSQLDRHMVLSSYAGLDPMSISSSLHNNLSSLSNPSDSTSAAPADLNAPFDIDLSSFNNSNFGAGGGNNPHHQSNVWDQSSAWFMPFNLDPPNLGADDTNFFQGAGYDLNSLGMHGFGDLSQLGLEQNLAPEAVGLERGEGDGGNMMEQ